MPKIELDCDFCRYTIGPHGRDGRGLLWLGGNDYVECPQCQGKKLFPMFEEVKTPPKIFLPPTKEFLEVRKQ